MAVVQPCMSEPKTDSDEESVLPQAKREQVFHPFISQTQFPTDIIVSGTTAGDDYIAYSFLLVIFPFNLSNLFNCLVFYSQTSSICVPCLSLSCLLLFTYTYKKCHFGIWCHTWYMLWDINVKNIIWSCQQGKKYDFTRRKTQVLFWLDAETEHADLIWLFSAYARTYFVLFLVPRTFHWATWGHKPHFPHNFH